MSTWTDFADFSDSEDDIYTCNQVFTKQPKEIALKLQRPSAPHVGRALFCSMPIESNDQIPFRIPDQQILFDISLNSQILFSF